MNPEALATLYVTLNFVAAALVAILAGYIILKQGGRNALTFAILLSATLLYALTNGVQMLCNTFEAARFFENLRWFLLATIPPVILVFVFDYTGRDQWLTPKWLVLLFTIPILTQIVVWSNHLHGWLAQPGQDEFISLGAFLLIGERTFGYWFWVHAAWSYALLLLALLIFMSDAISSSNLEWGLFAWLLMGSVLPLIFSIVDIIKIIEPNWFKLLPFGFILMTISFFVAIIKGQFINVLPVARGYLIETLRDAVFVVDKDYRAVDFNPAAQQLIGKSKSEVIGKPASEILQRWEELGRIFQDPAEVPTIASVVQDQTGRSYDLNISPLRTRRKKTSGWVIVLHDITLLKEAEARIGQLAAVIEQAHETVVITDLEGDIIYANPYFEITTGYTIEEAIGKNPNMLQSGQQDQVFYQGLWGNITQGEAWSSNFINKRKDGTLYHEAATIFPIKNGSGEIVNYAAVKRDITEQVQAEESFRNFSEGLAHLHEISMELSHTGNIEEMCRQAVQLGHRLLKFNRVGIWFQDQENPELLRGSFGIDENGEIRDERAQTMPIKDNSVHLSLLSGETRIFYNPDCSLANHKTEIVGQGEIAAAPLWDGHKIIGYISIDNYFSQQPINSYQRELLVLYSQMVGNLASRTKIRAEIRESEARYRLLADNAFDVIWTMDLQGNFTYMSPSVTRLRGYTPEEVLRQSLAEALTPESLTVAQAVMQEMLDTTKTGEKYTATPTFELEQPCKDGSTVWTEVITTLIYAEDETPLSILGVTRDISERKAADQALRNSIRHQELLNKITLAATEQTDFHIMLQSLADRMGELLDADGCFISLWDENKHLPIPAAAYGPFRESYPNFSPPNPKDVTLTESALTHEKVLVIADVYNTPYLSPKIAANFPTRSGLALPLIANNQKLGAALIAFDEQRDFTQAEINISEQAAHQIALAILKNKLLDEAQQRAKEAETLRQISATVASTLQEAEAIERILEEINRVVPYDSASVLLAQGTEMEIVGARGFENPSQILGLRFTITANTPNRVVAETRQPYIVENAPQKYPAFRYPPHDHIHSWMGIPLLIHDKLIGMLTIDSTQPGRFTPDHARLASAFADQVAIALENARLFEETRRLAITDSLTDIYNRRHFLELARREFDRTQRYKVPLSVIMLDIDHFKKINDTYGHLVGDQVLQTAAFICQKNLRSMDIIGRYGGEEFVILLPETPLHAENKPTPKDPLPAKIVAERLRQKIAQNTFEIGENSISITISLGVAEHTEPTINIENLIDFADRALLQAKSRGRNQVVSWNPEENIA